MLNYYKSHCIHLQCGAFNKREIFLSAIWLPHGQPIRGHYREDSLTNSMIITKFVILLPEGHLEPRNEFGS